MGIATDVELKLAALRADDEGLPDLRTSTLTHLVWAPPEWLPKVRRVLASLEERHPARTILLVPEPGRGTRVRSRVTLHDSVVHGLDREIISEVIELRLRGSAARHPASVVQPLLRSDLPVFCRWRGEPRWESSAFLELLGVVDRLVVDSSEWRGIPARYAALASVFDRVAVSDLAFARSLGWRGRLAQRWPGIRTVSHLRVDGPRADAALLGGWLRSRLRRDVRLTMRAATTIRGVWVDGDVVPEPDESPANPGDLLSAELEQFGRDPVYEAAVAAAMR